MTADVQNLNAERYSNEVFELWANHQNLNKSEDHLLNKYITDTSKHVLEAGTGGGRLSFCIEEKGFNHISAFDVVPNMIAHAKKRASTNDSNINFSISDAAVLENYDSDSFDYLLYLQQVLCFIDKKDLFTNALKEAYRVAKKDAIVMFSFLDYESKIYNPALSSFVNVLRKLRNEEQSSRHLPWLKINNDINWKLFHKNQPKTYWVKRAEITALLEDIGFSVVEAKNANQFSKNTSKRKGILYVVCKK